MSARPFAPWMAFFTCSAIWGSTFLLIAIGNDALPPVWAAALRLVLAGTILLTIARLRGQLLPRGAALRAATAYGVSYGVSFPLLYWGETLVPSGLTAVLFATLPLTTPLMARAFGLERLQGLKLAGGAIAFFGVTVIFWNELGGEVGVVPLLAVLAAAMTAGFGTIMLKRGPRQAPIPANGVASLLAGVICLGISFAVREPHPWPNTVAKLVPVLYLAILGSVIAFTLLAWLVNHWDATNISFISVVNPVIAVTLGVALRHEHIGPELLLGAGLVLLGVACAAISDRRAARARAA
jgi:drug/metabolite transporter (DMT)-like permease